MATSMVWDALKEECTQYEKAMKLIEESKNDPETEPYKSKYAAREILEELKTKIQSYVNDNEQNEDSCTQFIVNALEYQLGVNYMETEETSSGEEHFSKVLSALENDKLNEMGVSIVLSTYNQLGILWSARNDYQKALHYLQESERLYKQFMHEVGKAPHTIHELFHQEENSLTEHERQTQFEEIHTLTLYYLAQIHGKLDHKDLSAIYCYTTLKRQLETKQYDPVDWATNCATLSQFYLTADNYRQSRHCLASSSHIFQEALDKHHERDASEEEEEDPIPWRKADIARCWTKYCIVLLQASKEYMLRDDDEEDIQRREELLQECEDERQGACSHSDNSKPDDDLNKEEKVEEKEEEKSSQNVETASDPANVETVTDLNKCELRFESLELTAVENQVTDKLVKNFQEARQVFLAGQKWILESKEYYVIDGFVTDQISIIQDHSQLFKLLAFFESDTDRRCKMHKRRVDILQNILEDLNPQHFLQYCRQLQFEIAEAYSEMVDLKIILTEEQDRITPHAISKINSLIGQSIKTYQMFIDSLRSPDGQMPEKMEEDLVRPVLVAHFCMGRLHSKYIVADVRKKLENIQDSLERYQFLVEYCDKYPESLAEVKAEYEICKEMVTLLPLKMEQIKATS
ncbi:KIF-binding protein-like [Glandiceps talaboti]